MTKTIHRINQLIQDHQRFFVAAHENPEGDAIGATLALTLALRSLGKQVVLYNRDPVPRNLRFLPQVELVTQTLPEPIDDFDVLFIVDCGDLNRVGPHAEKLAGHPNLVNIDHHQTNDRFGTVNLVDDGASSAGQIVYRILDEGGIAVDPNMATSLFTAIYTDTMALRTASAGPESFRVCAELIRIGVDTAQVAEEYYLKQTETRLRLLSRALNTLQIASDGRIAGVTLTARDMEQTGASPDDIEGFIEFPRSIHGVEAAYVLREQGGLIKGSLRSGRGVNVAQVAEALGGGGHVQAAGFRQDGTLEEVRAKVIELLTGALL